MATTDEILDVAVIGAGVVGAAIARELARYRLRVRADRGGVRRRHRHQQGQHGHPAHRLRRQARHPRGAPGAPRPCAAQRLWRRRSASRSNPRGRCSSPGTRSNGRRCPGSWRAPPARGMRPHVWSSTEEVYQAEPHLGPGALGAMAVPDESIICPFTTPLAFATQAVVNGVTLALSSPVVSVAPRRQRSARAGDAARRVAQSLGRQRRRPARRRRSIACSATRRSRVTPRRGELIVFDKLARPLVSHIVLPVPTKASKGVLVEPDGVRQRHARADGRGHRRQDGDRLDRRGHRQSATNAAGASCRRCWTRR